MRFFSLFLVSQKQQLQALFGELGDIRRFKSANQINAFIGIDLKHYESGDFLGQEHITKRGNPYARKNSVQMYSQYRFS